MVSYVLNVRADQFDTARSALHLRRPSLPLALEAAGHEILLFASRDEGGSSYFASATMGDPVPDQNEPGKYWLPLHDVQPLSRPITLRELRALGVEEMPFPTYSHPIRAIASGEYLGLVTIGAIPSGFGEAEKQPALQPPYRQRLTSVENRRLRFEMIDAYSPRCAFLRTSYPDLSGLGYGVDVGHIWPRYAGGLDVINNVLPMSKDVNWHWDAGLIGLTNGGGFLIAKQAGADTRLLFANVTQVKFPDLPQFWPDALSIERHRDVIFEKGPAGSGY
jgi:hypothetical protein